MPALVVVGAQWGDEGKGKVVDLLSEQAKVVIRYSGGNNAGHTVVNSLGEFRMHLIPCGIFHPETVCLIGSGVVVDPGVLLEEMAMVRGAGVDLSNLFVSDRAHLIMPYHILQDGLDEEVRGREAIGTTRKGVGPAYIDKAARLGLRAGDLLDADAFLNRLRFVLEYKNALLSKFYGAQPLSLEEVYERYVEYGRALAPLICETEVLAQEAHARGDALLLEGAQGTLLDLDFGTYPYVTSSTPLAGGACLGTGLGPTQIDKVLGVYKAYSTRVGAGPLPTELEDERGALIRERAQEYGTTTGRSRRCGWFDGVAARFSNQVNHFSSAALMRLDVLDVFPTVQVCTEYRDGETAYQRFPSSVAVLDRCRPVYEELPGWQRPTSHLRRWKELPSEAQGYVRRLEEIIQCPIDLISVGPSREDTIIVRPLW